MHRVRVSAVADKVYWSCLFKSLLPIVVLFDVGCSMEKKSLQLSSVVVLLFVFVCCLLFLYYAALFLIFKWRRFKPKQKKKEKMKQPMKCCTLIHMRSSFAMM